MKAYVLHRWIDRGMHEILAVCLTSEGAWAAQERLAAEHGPHSVSIEEVVILDVRVGKLAVEEK